MLRLIFISTLLYAAVLPGCAKSEDQEAERAAGGLMPGAAPTFESEYVADQATVKSPGASSVSFEPLESFRIEPVAAKPKKPKPKEQPAKTANRSGPSRPKGASASLPVAKAPGAESSPGFWQRVGIKALTGAGRPKPDQNPPPKDGEDKAKKENQRKGRSRFGA